MIFRFEKVSARRFLPVTLLLTTTFGLAVQPSLGATKKKVTPTTKPARQTKASKSVLPGVRPLTDARFDWKVTANGNAIGISDYTDSAGAATSDRQECTIAINRVSETAYWRFVEGADAPVPVTDLSYFEPYSDELANKPRSRHCDIGVDPDRVGAARLTLNLSTCTDVSNRDSCTFSRILGFITAEGAIQDFRKDELSLEPNRSQYPLTPFSSEVYHPNAWFPLNQVFVADGPPGAQLFFAKAALILYTNGYGNGVPTLYPIVEGRVANEIQLAELFSPQTNAGGVKYNRYGVGGAIDENRLIVRDYSGGGILPWSIATRTFVTIPGLPDVANNCELSNDTARELLICDEGHRWIHYVLNGTYVGKIPNASAPFTSPYYIAHVRKNVPSVQWGTREVSMPTAVSSTDETFAKYFKTNNPVSTPKK